MVQLESGELWPTPTPSKGADVRECQNDSIIDSTMNLLTWSLI